MIPLLIILSRKIDSTATGHLPKQKDRDTLKAFWRIYVFYLKRGLKTQHFTLMGIFLQCNN